MLGLTTIAVVTFIYAALTQSPKAMKNYSYLLIYQTCALYTFDVSYYIFQPVFIFPYIGLYTNSFFDYGETETVFMALFIAANVMVLYHIIHVQEFYRLASLYPPNSWIFKFTQLKVLIFVFSPILIVVLSTLICKWFCFC